MSQRNTTYEQYRQAQMEDGRLFQDFAADALYAAGYPIVTYSSKTYQFAIGESRGGWEFKHDKRFKDTGNLYIECGEKARPRDGDYFPSGIYAANNTTFYVIGDYDRIFVFSRNLLVMLDKSGRYRRIAHNNTKTSTGFLLPGRDAAKYAVFILDPQLEIVVKNSQERVQEIEREAAEMFRVLAPQAADFTQMLPFMEE